MAWVGDAAEVFSALGTVGAFGVAMYLLRTEQQREAARTVDEQRAQATRVSAWIEARATPHGAREVCFHVHNASDAPIYDVSLSGLTPEDDEVEFIGLVPPGQTIIRAAPAEWIKNYIDPEPVPLEFLDSGGRAWVRDEQGALSEPT